MDDNTFHSAVFYRTVQVLDCLGNELQQKVIMSVIVIGATVVISICTTTIVWLPWIAENIIPLLMFSILGIDFILAVVTSL